jgi:hypothetical protein
MNSMTLAYWNEKNGYTQAHALHLFYNITAAKTVAEGVQGYPVLTAFDALASQAVIDDFLGTEDEFLLTHFDATSLGADVFAGLVNMGGLKGQVAKLVAMRASVQSGTDFVQRNVVASSSLTASTLVTECAVGAYGNIGFKVNFGNTPDFDALTSGLICVELHFRSK